MNPRPAVLALFLLVGMGSPVAAEIHTVGRNPDGLSRQDAHHADRHHDTLAAAVAAASAGDTLLLLPGDHRGRHVIDERLTITGIASAQQPRVLGQFVVRADGVVIQRVLFDRVGSPAIAIEGAADVLVRGCRFRRLRDGIELADATRGRVVDNRFELVTRPLRLLGGRGLELDGNHIDGTGVVAVDAGGVSDLRITGNTFDDLGWAGVALHSHGDGALVSGNVFRGGDVGLVVQTRDNRLTDNHFDGNRRGLLLGSSPFGMDPGDYERTSYLDSATGDHRIPVTGNVITDNVFTGQRREAVLLRDADDNRLERNRVGPSGRHGLVLMSGSDGNALRDNAFAERPGRDVLLVRSGDNVLADNRRLEGPGEPLAWQLECPADDDPTANRGTGLRRAGPDDLPPLARPALDGSGRLLVFGDFHTHSILSDGSCPPEDVLSYARDVAGFDFCALSDHGEVLSKQPDRWPRLNAVVAEAARPGRFVSLPGYEVTYPVTWEGHWNVYFSHDRGSLHRAPYDTYTGLADTTTFSPTRLVDALVAAGEPFLVIRHHYSAAPDYWAETLEDPVNVPATELCSVHGIFSGERDSNRNRNHPMGHDQDFPSSVAGGLAAGRVFGIVGSSDTHYGFPGDDGLAALMVDALTPEAVLDAVRARRSYATTGAPIALAFGVDDAGMGGQVSAGPGHELSIAVEGTAPIEEIVVLRGLEPWLTVVPLPEDGGGVGWHGDALSPWRADGSRLASTTDARSVRFRVTDERATAAGDHWRLRVRQRDGELAWSTPVWVDPGAPVLAAAALRHDKEIMSLMVYSSQLRAWPKLPLGALGGRSPAEAMLDPEGAAQVAALWPDLVASAERINAQARELGLVDRATAERVLERFHARWGNDLPRTILATEPVVDVEVLARQLGLEP